MSTIDTTRVEEFAQRVFGDLATAHAAALTHLGDRLGLFAILADSGPVTPAALAERSGYAERYLREWLAAQAALGYLTYDPAAETFTLPPEHAAVLADDSSPFAMAGGFGISAALWTGTDLVAEGFRTGDGVSWGEHDTRLFEGVHRFFEPGYRAHLVSSWLPAIGVVERLEQGARVLDVGCGHGSSTILMAEAFPASQFVGVDFHPESVEAARKAAAEAGVADRVRFEVASATEYEPAGCDLVCFFDVLHDLGDPVGAAAHARAALADDGVVLLVEPRAGDRVEDNLHPLGQAYYAASTMLCTPNALSQGVGLALGAQAGEARLREVLTAGGLSQVRRAAETEVNIVLAARP
ncbi:MAG TPA: class I SAM-dependent methyltransferase [Egibacteraceae bacterium]